MDKQYVKTAIEGLKSTSSSQVQESLLKIRSKVISHENGIKIFTECGGLTYLVSHLRKSNERILDLALSILGNCCLNDDCRLAVSKLNIVVPLISVLKNVCRDSIVGRACRVVGNLAQKTSNAEELHYHGVVPALISLIESRDKNMSYPTLAMAVRAIRLLWMVIDKREEMLSINSVRCISILLTTECEAAGILKSDNPENVPSELRKSQEELISGILKCLGYFTTHATAQCAEQIEGDGRSYQCLVALTKTFEPLALKCLMNLCFLSNCRPLLGTAGLVPSLVGILQKNSDVCWWPEGAARTLAQLSGESVNRARIRQFGGLPLLIAAAREHTFALRALLQYVFDDVSFQMLVNEGLIGLVTEELQKHLTTMKCEHDYTEPLKEKIAETSIETNTQDNTCQESLNLFKRRKLLSNSNEDGLSVVIERDNMYVGFSETVDSDASDSQNEYDKPRKRLKRARSKSPTAFMKRCRLWNSGVYWEMKSDRETSTSRALISPEPAPMSPGSDGTSGFSPEYRSSSKRWDWSPESGFGTGESSVASPYNTEYPWSPSSSAGPTSPFSMNEESSDSEISGRYSPVCSEHETEAAETAEITVELDAAQAAMDELAVDDGDVGNDDEPFDQTEKESDADSSRIACVLVLLYRLSNGSYDTQNALVTEPATLNNLLELLTSNDCLTSLLDYVEKCRKPMGRAARILTLIFKNPLCLVNLLKHKIALRLHNMSLTTKHPVSKCQQCRLIKKLSVKLMTRLTILAESCYGIGEISFQLLRGPDSIKETLSLTLPYIVKSKPILRKYYVECSALIVLFANVPETTAEFEYYVTALGKLATNVQIKDPKVLETRFKEQGRVGHYPPILDNTSRDEIVTFELDDSSTVKANRTFLCQNSEVFSAMLMGCFKESIEESVKIKNVSKPGLEYLLTLLHCGLNNAKCDVQVFPLPDKLETSLEVLLLADRFLFDNLKDLLNSAILQFKMTPDNADKIYIWSLNEGMGFLCVESVAYLLTGKMCETNRARAFKNILNLEYKEQWLEDIKSIIMRHSGVARRVRSGSSPTASHLKEPREALQEDTRPL